MDWKPTATLKSLQARAKFLQKVRNFFTVRQVLEVDTPILSAFGTTEVHLQNYVVMDPSRNNIAGYLQTSPESFMKRLLAADSGPIYQIAKVFRAGEIGRLHHPEFTMLEWYRPGFSLEAIMQETLELVEQVFEKRSMQRLSYGAVFEQWTGINPHQANVEELKAFATKHLNFHAANPLNQNLLLDLIFSHRVQPNLGKDHFTIIHSFPESQAALAKLKTDLQGNQVAERFELFIDGIEIANGYHELTDPIEQRNRFFADQQLRAELCLPNIELDFALLQALEQGLPSSSGVALGLDRLFMLCCGATNLQEVLSFK